MEQQAKERLTGAVILVALLVLLVPELLTGPRPTLPPAPAQPDQAPMRAYTMDLGESTHTNSAPVAASTAAPLASTPAALASAPQPQLAPMPTFQGPAAVAQTPVPPVMQPTVKPTTPVVHPHVAAPLHATPHSAAAWTVQIATFSNRDNAARLVAKLKSQGFSASIAETTAKNGSKLFRVRTGTEKDRAGAQKLLGRLRVAGEKGGEVVPR